jgi:hypothetical protein
LCGIVVAYAMSRVLPAVTLVAGQSDRARSSPENSGRSPLHRLPSGMNCLSRPATPGTRRLSKLPNGRPLAAEAALHAAPAEASLPGVHAAVRLIGLVVAPWARAG